MCGIVGIFDPKGQRPIDRDLLSRMNDSQYHRGPDDDGLFVDPGIGLGFRRLAIIDLSGGAQPLFNEDHSVVIVFNGEIYNFKQLVPVLEARGHIFRTRSDTEVIVHAWEEWGPACVDRLRGMFGFAIWDKRQQTLFLARDRVGEKPIYYSELADGTFIFGSELKSLLTHPATARTLDPRAVEDYFAYGYVPDPKSIYKGVRKLPPGHTLTLRRGTPVPAPRAYWDVAFRTHAPRDERAAIDELSARLREAVDMRMVADVPVGAFLSGGVDSSGVVALMAGLSREPVNTCSISFGQKEYDESRYAQEVATRYGTRHHVRQVTEDDFELVDRLALFYDEPFADSSAMPTYRVCQLARERVTVALSGDGGDEVFAGYRRYRWHHYEELVRGALPAALRRPLFGFLAAVYPKADWAPRPFRAKSTLQAIARDTIDAYFRSVGLATDEMRARLFSASFTRELQGYNAREVLEGHMRAAPADDHLAQIQYADLKTYLSGDILVKVDRASMANSLEVRVPILDHELIEWAAGLPLALKLRGGEGKYVFKKALEPLVPHELLYRPKMGFSVPLARWFRGPLRQRLRDALTSSALADAGVFDMGYLATLVDQHQAGIRDHSAALWSLLMFESFWRQVHRGRHDLAAVTPREPVRAAARS
jgi:asparagine synthase (glutamine-hydrolysing)